MTKNIWQKELYEDLLKKANPMTPNNLDQQILSIQQSTGTKIKRLAWGG